MSYHTLGLLGYSCVLEMALRGATLNSRTHISSLSTP
ncbi:unnamed protein product [Ixodes pacificus]